MASDLNQEGRDLVEGTWLKESIILTCAVGEAGGAAVEGPRCGPHRHAVAGAGAQVPEDVTPGIPTQHRAPSTAGGCVTDFHHVAFCSSPRCCPGGLQRGGRGAAEGEVGRSQGIWKATGDSQPPRAIALRSVP